MKTKWMIVKKYIPFLLAMLIMDCLFCLLLWIADIQAFRALSLIIILGSILLFAGIIFIILRHEIKFQEAFQLYINIPSELHEETLLGLSSPADRPIIKLLGRTLSEKQYNYEQLLTRVSDYEEYVEAWAHETKTPISLLTLLLDNHTDEIPENISLKMDYIRNRMQEYVNQMLFYAKLKSDKKDYFFETIYLSECLDDIIEDYKPLLEEKHFQVNLELSNAIVHSDRRGLHFLLSQIISNSIKYSKLKSIPELSISFEMLETNSILTIKDNGVGVRTCDLPYIFEKGFTGNSGENRKKATGMGLYLAKEIADDLKLILEATSEWMNGFEMKIIFPKINEHS